MTMMDILNTISIEEEMKRNPELKKSDIEILVDWCRKQAHLPKMPEVSLVFFLHSNYFRLEPTKKTIENFYTIRTHVPEFFSNRDPLGVKELRQIMNVVTVFAMPATTKEGYKVLFAKLIDFDTSKFSYVDTIKYFTMVADLWIIKSGTCPGIVFLTDAADFSFGHAARMNPVILKKFMTYVQEAAPIRLKGIHVLNTHPVVDTIINIAKPFLKLDILQMIHLHSNMESLTQHIPLECIPKDLGGKGESIMEMHEREVKNIENHRDFFIELDEFNRVDESLRVGKPVNTGDLFGVEGTFKKLDID